ncbi:MAG: DUF1674 domain-containing protein [Methylococcus sp.]
MTDIDLQEQRQGPEDASDTSVRAEQPKEHVEEITQPVQRPDPTRYGDWEKSGRCIDF